MFLLCDDELFPIFLLIYNQVDLKKNSPVCDGLIENDLKLCEAQNFCENDDCLFTASMQLLNEDLCFEISDENLRIDCTSKITTNILLANSVINDDIESCSQFESSEMKSFCEDNYYLANAVNNEDTSLCDSITSEEIRNECYK